MRSITRRGPLAAAALFLAALAACAPQANVGAVPAGAVGVARPTLTGVVEATRAVPIQTFDQRCRGYRGSYGCGRRGTLGGLLGATAGGLIGSVIGQGAGRAVAIGVGATVGSIAGSRASRQVQSEAGQIIGQEVVVLLDDGRRVTIVQADVQALSIGQPVFVQAGRGGNARVTPRVG